MLNPLQISANYLPRYYDRVSEQLMGVKFSEVIKKGCEIYEMPDFLLNRDEKSRSIIYCNNMFMEVCRCLYSLQDRVKYNVITKSVGKMGEYKEVEIYLDGEWQYATNHSTSKWEEQTYLKILQYFTEPSIEEMENYKKIMDRDKDLNLLLSL